MTPRLLLTKLLQRGKQVFSQFKTAYKAEVKVAEGKQQQITQSSVRTRPFRFSERVNTLWTRAIPRAYYKTWASELRRQAAWRTGNLPLLGFAGFVLAHGFEEEENVVDQISNTVKDSVEGGSLLQQIQALSLDQFEFGSQIGQGCNAAVYEARLRPLVEDEEEDNQPANEIVALTVSTVATDDDVSDTESDLTVLDMSDDDLDVDDRAPTEFPDPTLMEFTALTMTCSEILSTIPGWSGDVGDDVASELSDFDVLVEIGEYESLNSSILDETENSPKFNLAVKMMFNYGIESNAATILREMEKEAVPARLADVREQMEPWENGTKVRKKRLPPHPNVVEMWSVFADPVPRLPEGLDNYPAALPSRLNPKGIGRNMTMFLVMKKYDSNLKEYLSKTSLEFREQLHLLAQLFEAVVHLKKHDIVHRDMKSDNILLDLSSLDDAPSLVLSDFGCCLADSVNGLKLPYPTDEIDRGGNTALMPPEIACATPGRSAVLDYSRADLWGAGALAYEILGGDNPFYSSATRQRLDSRSYSEAELPPLPDHVPASLKKLVTSMLSRDPRKRPSPSVAANVLQVMLWAPSDWLLLGNCTLQNVPGFHGYKVKRSEVTWWLAAMAAEVILFFGCHGNTTSVINLKKSFLERLNLNELYAALGFMGVTVDTSD